MHRGGRKRRRQQGYQRPYKKAAHTLYDSSWLDDPWKELEGGQSEPTGKIYYHESWLNDPWESVLKSKEVVFYHKSWLEDPWKNV